MLQCESPARPACSSTLRRPTHLLRMVICVVFTTLQTSYVLLFTVALTCGSKSEGYANAYFPSRPCFAMPQAALFGLSLFMVLLYTAISALFALIETGATEPLSNNLLSLSGGLPAAKGVAACAHALNHNFNFQCLVSNPSCSSVIKPLSSLPSLQPATTSSCGGGIAHLSAAQPSCPPPWLFLLPACYSPCHLLARPTYGASGVSSSCRLLKFTLPLVPVALRTVPRWEVSASQGRTCGRSRTAACMVAALAARFPHGHL